jgi:hypothetical protein
MVRPERFELPTYCSGGNRSIHLSYGRTVEIQFTPCARLIFRLDPGRQGLPAIPVASSAIAPAAVSTVASAAAIATPSSGVLGLGPGLVDVERSSSNLRAVQRGDGFFSFFVVGHFHKTEPARTAGVTVGQDADAVDLPIGLENLPEFVFRGIEIQVPYKDILHAPFSCIELSSASSMRRTGR